MSRVSGARWEARPKGARGRASFTVALSSGQHVNFTGCFDDWPAPTGASCAQVQSSGVQEAWKPVGAPKDQACRGADPSDNSPYYYTVSLGKTLADCKSGCLDSPACVGIEHNSGGRCEVWHHLLNATKTVKGYMCLRRPVSANV